MFEYVISNNDVSFIWQYAQKHNLGVGYSQSDYFVANKMTHGFELDMHNCDVDYILTNHMEKIFKRVLCGKCLYRIPNHELIQFMMK